MLYPFIQNTSNGGGSKPVQTSSQKLSNQPPSLMHRTKTSQNNVRVTMEYSWEFSLEEWEELRECNEESQIDILKKKIEWDPISIFHHLNDMTYPDVSMSVESASKKSN